MFKGPHGIFIDRHDYLWLADDKDHTVHKFTTDGKRLMTLGESGKAADTGYKIGASPVQRAAGPFHRVTNVAVLPSGDMYIADGYGNARVHKFSAEGKLLFSWGEPGRGPGQFMLPHGIWVHPDGRVLTPVSGDNILIEKGKGQACGRILQLDYGARHGGGVVSRSAGATTACQPGPAADCRRRCTISSIISLTLARATHGASRIAGGPSSR